MQQDTAPYGIDSTWAYANDGARLAVRTFGPPDAPAIVLAHGWACSTEYWKPQFLALQDRFHVITYDQRGHGRSSRGTQGIDAVVLADDFAAVIDHALGDRRAVIAGHSMGGITLQAWWQQHPEQAGRHCAATVLANTASGGILHGTRVLPFMDGRRPSHERIGRLAFGTALPLPGGPVLDEAVRRLVMNPRTATSREARFLSNIVRHCDPRVRARTALALAYMELGDDAPAAITTPTTVTVGTHDRITPPWMGRAIATVLERTGHLDRLVEFDTGHAGTVEVPDEFTALLADAADTHL